MKFRSALLLSLGLALGLPSAAIAQQPASIPVTEAIPDDPDVAKVLNPLKAEIKATFDLVLVQCPTGLYKGGNGRENELGEWIADAMRVRAEALVGAPVKFAYTNTGGIRANIRPGVVKVGDIYEVMPFENELVVAELTGAEIVEVVKEGILRRAVEPMSGIRARTGGTVAKPELIVTWADGSAIDPKEVVKLATSDYLLASSAVMKKSRNGYTTGRSLRQVLLDVCVGLNHQGKPLTPPPAGRMTLDPVLLQALKTEK
jgi:2',3'-cyclic-nucleotide 2'-phosphodiesterase (5'-nucleotidase family)